eukprot:gnl/TRDRNA2_/TRDRNA2_169681_c0_seq2.p1 gnl/TRDRNA2_/TRDRNA2_169681_c0~~gnl/TRDRNA2_/TRDRNA2_169681_c0_seq2.p1  ORF type:complete len:483 (-),score=54.78 gnl/TRDRNA2_/TRDRNA2_169681_c0_seq2:97-1389(-)
MTWKPKCFPGASASHQVSTEVVRSQGTCASCWAFAGASALAHQLCTSKDGDQMFIGTDRLEVGVQGIMNCNTQGLGCNGGNMGSFHTGLQQIGGPARERDFPYQHKRGGCFPESKFRKEQAVKWNYQGMTFHAGEQGIAKGLAMGYAMWVYFQCATNFISGYPSGYGWTNSGGTVVYVGPASGSTHAVVLVAYGKTPAGMKYWRMQNSWGERWGDGGFANFKKGVNLGGLENFGAFPKGWVEGGTVPPCYDSSATGLTNADGSQASCEDAARGNWCDGRYGYKERLKAACPVACKGQSPCNPGSEPPYRGQTKPATTTTTTATTTATTTTTVTTTTTTTTSKKGGGESGVSCAAVAALAYFEFRSFCDSSCKSACDDEGKKMTGEKFKECATKCRKDAKKRAKKACEKAIPGSHRRRRRRSGGSRRRRRF